MSPRLTYRVLEFAPLALALLPAQMPRAERAQLVVTGIGIQAALALPQYTVISTSCAEPRMADSNQRQTCAALAELLVAKGPTLIDLHIGRRIGERAGWSPERVEGLGAKFEALMQVMIDQQMGAPGGHLSCATAERAERWWREQAPIGERAAAERTLERTGWSEAQIMERYRQRLRQRAAEAAAPAASEAAPAASAASTPR